MEGKIDVCNGDLGPRIIETKWDRINQLLGVELTADNIRDILESLSFEVEVKGDTLKVTVPSYRQDVMGMADLAEEVARIYGYDKIRDSYGSTIAQGSRTRGKY